MIKETITYTDYNGNERTEDFYFNLTKAECAELELSVNGGISAMIENIIAAQEQPKLVSIFKEFILKAYGVKSIDGKRFMKNDEIRTEFVESEAYSILFMKLATDSKKAAEFFNGVIPKDDNKIAVQNQ